MSKTKRQGQRQSAPVAAERPLPVAAQRVDGPHTLGTGACTAADEGFLAAAAPVAAVETRPADAETGVAATGAVLPEAPLFLEAESGPHELMQAQAEELAAFLRERQRELDHREAQLHAALARLDHDARKTRLLAEERQQELAERQAALDTLAAELTDRASRLAAAEQFVESARRDGEGRHLQATSAAARREEQLHLVAERLARQEAAGAQRSEDARLERERAEAELLHKRQHLDARRAASVRFVQMLLDAQDRRRLAIELRAERVTAERRAALAELADREAELQQTVGQWQARERRLLEAEAAHAQEQADLAEERRELEIWHAGVLARLEQERRDDAARRQEAEDELAARRQTLERRAELLDARQVALDQQLEEVRRLHREGLEARLAGEELWVQLSASAPTATLARSLGRTRAQLTDQYRLANAELAARKQELEGLSVRLEQRFGLVQAERSDVQQWVARRQEELERQAAQLVAQEQELERQSEDVRRRRNSWNDERRDYRRQIQRLREELRGQHAEVATALGV